MYKEFNTQEEAQAYADEVWERIKPIVPGETSAWAVPLFEPETEKWKVPAYE